MAIFDKKTWNDAVFQKYLKKVPNLKENSLLKNGVLESNQSLKARLVDGVGGKLAVEQRYKKRKERHPNHAAGDIWHQQSPGAVFDVWKCGASYRTVEITGLEKEEAHQVEAPAHYLFPPIFPIESRKLKGVQHHHANDA